MYFIIESQGVSPLFHYLDDFFIVSESAASCALCMQIMMNTFEEAVFAIALIKLEDPATCVQIDALKQRIPHSTLIEFQQKIQTLRDQKCASIQELQSISGSLNYAAAY